MQNKWLRNQNGEALPKQFRAIPSVHRDTTNGNDDGGSSRDAMDIGEGNIANVHENEPIRNQGKDNYIDNKGETGKKNVEKSKNFSNNGKGVQEGVGPNLEDGLIV